MEPFAAQGDNIVTAGRYQARVRLTGRRIDSPLVHLWTVRHGMVVKCQELTNTATEAAACAKTAVSIAPWPPRDGKDPSGSVCRARSFLLHPIVQGWEPGPLHPPTRCGSNAARAAVAFESEYEDPTRLLPPPEPGPIQRAISFLSISSPGGSCGAALPGPERRSDRFGRRLPAPDRDTRAFCKAALGGSVRVFHAMEAEVSHSRSCSVRKPVVAAHGIIKRQGCILVKTSRAHRSGTA